MHLESLVGRCYDRSMAERCFLESFRTKDVATAKLRWVVLCECEEGPFLYLGCLPLPARMLVFMAIIGEDLVLCLPYFLMWIKRTSYSFDDLLS